MTLMFTQGHRVAGKIELVLSFCFTETIQVFVIFDYYRKMTVKKSRKYREYGSFEHLLLLLFLIHLFS